VPVQSIFSKGARRYVFLENGGSSPGPVEVQIGVSNNEYVEVISGIEEGQSVLLAVSDDLKRLLPEDLEEETAETFQQPAVAGQTPQPRGHNPKAGAPGEQGRRPENPGRARSGGRGSGPRR
jgi:hypothetical protein